MQRYYESHTQAFQLEGMEVMLLFVIFLEAEVTGLCKIRLHCQYRSRREFMRLSSKIRDR